MARWVNKGERGLVSTLKIARIVYSDWFGGAGLGQLSIFEPGNFHKGNFSIRVMPAVVGRDDGLWRMAADTEGLKPLESKIRAMEPLAKTWEGGQWRTPALQ